MLLIPTIALIKELLPLPLSPTNPMISPSWISKLKFSTALTVFFVLRKIKSRKVDSFANSTLNFSISLSNLISSSKWIK